MQVFAVAKQLLEMLGELQRNRMGIMLFGRGRESGELVFSYKPEIQLSAVVEAFKEFYFELNKLVFYDYVSRMFDSGRAALLYAVSGTTNLEYLLLGFSNLAEGKCLVEFMLGGTSDKMVKSAHDEVAKFFTESAEQFLTLESWRRASEVGGEGTSERLCTSCWSVISRDDALYCPKCGKALTPGEAKAAKKAPAQGAKAKTAALAGTCMVCKMQLEAGQPIAKCPFCGAAAHRVHLLEYLHVKEDCPACGHHLEERDMVRRPSRRGAGGKPHG